MNNPIHENVHRQDGMHDFFARFHFLLSGRQPYPFGEGAGINRGTISRVLKGNVPTHESLASLVRVENASISWLLEGKGSPYLVTYCQNDADCREMLDAWLEEDGWTLHLVMVNSLSSLILTQPGQFDNKGKMIDYTIIEILAGPMAEKTMDRIIEAQNNGHPVMTVRVSPTVATKIYKGRMGTYALLHAPGAPLRPAEPMRLNVTEGDPVTYNLKNAVEADAGDLLDTITEEVLDLLKETKLELPADKQARLIVMIYRRLLKAGNKPSKDEMKELIRLAK